MQKKLTFCRWSPTLGELEDTAENIWGTLPYEADFNAPTVFFGLYGLPDFYALWRHKGKRWILWAGTDIIHFKNGYWLEDGGGIRLDPQVLAEWIDKHCENWCENEVEQATLREVGIEAHVGPSFLGDVMEFNTSYHQNDIPQLYASVSGDNFEQYGWHLIPDIARANPGVEFHLYGNRTQPPYNFPENVILHGRVPKEQMNDEIKRMQGGLRLTRFDGFSEILAKSVLWGQWPVSLIPYPHMLGVDQIGMLKDKNEANYAGRHHYQNILNKYPWNTK